MSDLIVLEQLTKHYPGQEKPAVDALDLTIPEGEIVILVGPSGCGKTTTLKMINRIIEPSSGIIRLQGEDVTRADPDDLRRRIGYVIQQVGLFPHHTIGRNIAAVPRLLGWSRQRIDDRLDELFHLVGMDPAIYRDRYPKELSGGQRQRIGVARALAADPPVMLMDEPFGALDPISRERLQNEFLRLQGQIGKTIVFVTHDIDEAIKMGDRIAILREGSTIAQYDTPETVLAAPADDFVKEFIGSGASLKGLGLARVREVSLADWPTSLISAGREAARRALDSSDHGWVLLLDEQRRPVRWAEARALQGEGSLDRVGLEVRAIVEPTATLVGALESMLGSRVGVVVIVDGSGAFVGTVDMRVIMSAVESMRAAAHKRVLDDRQRMRADQAPAASGSAVT